MKPKETIPKQPPEPPRKEVEGLLALYNAGRYAEVESGIRALLKIYPEFGFGWKLLGGTLQMQGKDALPAFRKATELMPADPEAHFNLGVVLKSAGRLADAAASYRTAITLNPGYAEAHSNLGNALKELGQLDDAIASYRKAVALKPDDVLAYYNLGKALKQRGQLDEAIASYRKAVELKPDFAEAHNNLGTVLKDHGQFDAALASYRRVIELKPDFAEAHNSLGMVLQDTGQLDAARASYRRALEIKPDFAEAHCNFGNTLRRSGQRSDMAASYRRALEIKPDYAEAHSNLGNALRSSGQLNEAEASYRRALEIKPDFAIVYSNLLFFYSYHCRLDPKEYLIQARNWELCCVPEHERQLAQGKTFKRSSIGGRRLRVGYVSGDFRKHPVSYFIEQLFARHDRTRVELFAYSSSRVRDAVTERLQSFTDHWTSIVGMSGTAVLDQIEANKIDVLVDLSGHSENNRMGVFARRAAPVQAYYLGYFASTGLTEMDYWIGDEFLTPPETDSHFSEQVWRLPRISWSYDAKDAPLSAWRPDPDGAVWIGSFNNLGKLTPATLALWAKVLHALPEGRLLLKNKELSDAGNRRRILETMSEHGIPSNRIELQDRTPDWSAHMAYYNRLDIALDPVGAMGGVTTSFDALWMAVPVITMQGDRVASRATSAIVSALGHAEWVAISDQEYIDKVVALARDVEQRKTLRSAQRERMAVSPLCDAKGLASSLENAYTEMFELWLQNKMDGVHLFRRCTCN